MADFSQILQLVLIVLAVFIFIFLAWIIMAAIINFRDNRSRRILHDEYPPAGHNLKSEIFHSIMAAPMQARHSAAWENPAGEIYPGARKPGKESRGEISSGGKRLRAAVTTPGTEGKQTLAPPLSRAADHSPALLHLKGELGKVAQTLKSLQEDQHAAIRELREHRGQAIEPRLENLTQRLEQCWEELKEKLGDLDERLRVLENTSAAAEAGEGEK